MPELKDIMTREVEVISPDATTADAALRMAKLGRGGYACL
jgi:CBS domain-containing protein